MSTAAVDDRRVNPVGAGASARATFIERLEQWCEADRGHPAYTFLEDGEVDTRTIGYAELAGHVGAFASVLRTRCRPGDRVLVMLEPGLEYVTVLLACFAVRAVAVPAAAPPVSAVHHVRRRLATVWRDCRPAVLVASAETIAAAKAGTDPWCEGPWLDVDELLAAPPAAIPDRPRLDDVAVLQYTSGSTAAAKGVVLRHRQLVHNAEMLRDKGEHGDHDSVVLWLPPFHDMGLMGGLLQPLNLGIHSVLFAPARFMQRPLRWAEAISRYRATTSGGPNFAFDLLGRRLERTEPGPIDLSSWEVAYVGAEPVRAETLRSFATAAEPFGFDVRALLPSYGLAESTVLVTAGRRGDRPVTRAFMTVSLAEGAPRPAVEGTPATELVGCGAANQGVDLVVVNPVSEVPSPPGMIGEVWVASGSVADGYWEDEEATSAVFGSRLPGRDGRYLRTRDLAFVDDGELFVVGRTTDVMIVHGRQLYPSDIEATVEHLGTGRSIAFSVRDGADELPPVVVVSTRPGMARDVASLPGRVREAVAEAHGVVPSAVLVVRPKSLPLTVTTGKMQRGVCRERFLAGLLDPVASWVSPRVETVLRAQRPDDRMTRAPSPSERHGADPMMPGGRGSPITPLVEIEAGIGSLTVSLWLKDERRNPTGSIKDRSAAAMVEALLRSDGLQGRRGIVESTSGNLGAALARCAAELGTPFVAVTDPLLSPDLARKIESLGATLCMIRDGDEAGNYLNARLDKALAMETTGDWVWTRQYSNIAQLKAHELTTGPELDAQLPASVDELYVAVSTCGTLGGLGTYFRRARPDMKIVAVDVEGSVVFGGAARVRCLTGIGAARRPEFDLDGLFDEVEVVPEGDAVLVCRTLRRQMGLGVGGSTGAVIAACLRRAQTAGASRRAAAVIADGADNYRATIFDDTWVSNRDLHTVDLDAAAIWFRAIPPAPGRAGEARP